MTGQNAVAVVALVVGSLLAPSGASALDGCKASIDKKTGVLEVSANNVVGQALWGPTASTVSFRFDNEATCANGGKMKECSLGAPSTLAATTPPPGCTLYIDDESGDGTCAAFISKNCANLTAVPGTLGEFLSLASFKRVFVTSTTQNGNLGQLVGADGVCQGLADAAGLGGTWTAWLSTSGDDAANRISDAEYRLVDRSTVVAFSLSDLLDCANPDCLRNPIHMSETGGDLSSVAVTRVWTGTEADGTKGAGSGVNCFNWSEASSSGPIGRYGDLTSASSAWTDSATTSCTLATAYRLYCFEN